MVAIKVYTNPLLLKHYNEIFVVFFACQKNKKNFIIYNSGAIIEGGWFEYGEPEEDNEERLEKISNGISVSSVALSSV